MQRNIRQFREMRVSRGPHLGLTRIFLHDIVQMKFERFEIGLFYPLKNIDDDTCEAVFVEVDFLIVGYLSNFAS